MPNTILHPILTKNLTLKQAQHKRNVVFNQLPPFNLLFGRVYISWRVYENYGSRFSYMFHPWDVPVYGFEASRRRSHGHSWLQQPSWAPTPQLPLFQVGPSNRVSGED